MLILAIESTCDETGAAIVRDGVEVLSNIVASQTELHAKYRGVVPEIASRAHIENILPVIREAVSHAGCDLENVDAIAVAHRPGLIGSLLIGVTAAKTLAWSLAKPLIGVDHVQAHLYSVMLSKDEGGRMKDEKELTPSPGTPGEGRGGGISSFILHPSSFPSIGLVCSGGHTALYRMHSFTEVQRIGSTIDDAVGEAYDKVAAILGLGYPGGPILDRLAQNGNPAAIPFPRTLLEKDSLDFSFSGLKTAVLYHVHGIPQRNQTKDQRKAQASRCLGLLSEKDLQNIAASFQAACVDILIEKLRRAANQFQAKSILIGGGVSANSGLRHAAAKLPAPVYFPKMEFCTDNAAMSAGLAHLYLQQGKVSPLNLDAIAN